MDKSLKSDDRTEPTEAPEKTDKELDLEELDQVAGGTGGAFAQRRAGAAPSPAAGPAASPEGAQAPEGGTVSLFQIEAI